MGCSGSTSSTSKAALSAIRRAPQLGQKPRRLQLKATSARRGKTRSEPVESHAPAARIGEILQIPVAHSPAIPFPALP